LRTSKYILPGLALSGALFAIVYTFGAGVPEQPRDLPSIAPEASIFSGAVHGVGIVEASGRNISIGSPVGDIVAEVKVAPGMDVAAGQTLFRLDSRSAAEELAVRRSEVATARSRLEELEVLLADAEEQLARVERLPVGIVISAERLARLRFQALAAAARKATADAEITSSYARLRLAQQHLEQRTIRAPAAGKIIRVNVREGEFAVAGQMSDALVVMMPAGPLQVRVEVDQRDARRVAPNSPAVALSRENPARRFELKFLHIEPLVVPKRSLTGDDVERVDTRVLQVVYEVLIRSSPLYIGQQVDVQISTPTAADRK
jgi:HlyD family secretion protein